MKRETNIKFIHQGKLYRYMCKFSGYEYGVLPIYYCDDIEDMSIIQTVDKRIMIIMNKSLEENEIERNLLIWRNLLDVYYGKREKERLKDSCCARWFGYENTIKFITEHALDKGDERIQELERILLEGENEDLPTKHEILSNIQYIKVVG